MEISVAQSFSLHPSIYENNIIFLQFLTLNSQAAILVVMSVALAEEVAEKKPEKRWAYSTGYGYNDGRYNNAYGGNYGYNQAYNQLGTPTKGIFRFLLKCKQFYAHYSFLINKKKKSEICLTKKHLYFEILLEKRLCCYQVTAYISIDSNHRLNLQ